MQINWSEDVQAKAVIEKLGLKYVDSVIGIDDIDEKASRLNHARVERIDKEHAESIAIGMKVGLPIPKLVIRNKDGRHIIAGGNHRHEACKKTEQQSVQAYIVTCSDGEFNLLCRELNACVGKGSTHSERVQHAADAVEAKQKTRSQASDDFGVTANAIGMELRKREADRRLAAMNGKAKKVPVTLKPILSDIQANAVFEKAVELASSKGLTTKEARAVIADAKSKPELDALNILDDAIVRLKQEPVVKTTKRTVFLRALSAFESQVLSVKKLDLDNFDIGSEEKEEVMSRCRAIARIMNSL